MAKMTFYSRFNKRENSTKQPTGGTSYNVVFKENFSITGGTVKLQASFSTAMSFTAAMYGSNYYKVDDVVSVTNDIVDIILSLDVLATYRSDIISYTGLLERAPSSSEINYLPDNTITSNGNLITNKVIWSEALVLDYATCYQIKTSNSESAQCYFTTVQGLINFSKQLDKIWEGDSINLISEINMVKLSISDIGNLQQAVATRKIVVGNTPYDISADVYAFYQPSVMEISYTPSLSNINFTYSDARLINRNYTKISFVINNTEVFLDSCYNRTPNFLIKCTVDINTLSVLTQIWVKSHTDNKLFYSGYTNIGIGYSLSNDNANQIKSITTAFRLATDVASKDYKGLISEIPNLVHNVPASSSGSAPGTTLSITDLFMKIYLYEYGSTEKSAIENGYPYYKVGSATSVNIGGFYKFKNPQLGLAAPSSIKSAVNSYMANGFFYE